MLLAKNWSFPDLKKSLLFAFDTSTVAECLIYLVTKPKGKNSFNATFISSRVSNPKYVIPNPPSPNALPFRYLLEIRVPGFNLCYGI